MRLQVTVQGRLRDRASWLALARRVEVAGFEGLSVPDHPGAVASPFVALAAAAAVTERIRLGTCVVNAGVWEPLPLAAEVAALDAVSGGRALLGVGAGHTPTEWTATGRSFPTAGARVDRMVELVEAVRALLAGGPVSHRGRHVVLDEATLDAPAPVQRPVPLLVGGNGRRVLRYGADVADRVGVTGLGRTLADGHDHAVDWRPDVLDRAFDDLRAAAARAGRSPVVEALVQHVELADDAERAAARLADAIEGASAADLLDAPFVWLGTPTELAAQAAAHRQRWGITSYVVREPAIDAVQEVLAAGG